MYLRVMGNTFAGNYFQHEGDSMFSKITTTSLNESRVCIAKIENNEYKGGYEIFEDGVLVLSSIGNTSNMVMIAVPVSIIHNYQLHVLIQMLGIGQPNWYSTNPNNYTYLEYLEPAGDGGNPDGSGGNEEIIEFEIDDPDSKPGVNITQLFNCFDQVPGGPSTTYSITLNADIPVNSNETFPVLITNPGHVFLTITKTNGSQSVTQSFGFYPQVGRESLTLNSVPSKIVNDGNHEINASIRMPDINEASFNLIKYNAIYEASQLYNLSTNNCANFAIKLFNYARSNSPISVPIFHVTIPSLSGIPILNLSIIQSPQALYSTLNTMKNTGNPEAANIHVNRNRSTKSPPSQGECP